jgi:glutathione S-transferase
MLIVHHLGVSQSERVVWLCEELGIPYELRKYNRDSVTRLAPAAYRALHPMGIAPVVNDGDLVLGESGAIVQYLIERYGDGRLALKANHADFAQYLFWFHFANGTMMPAEMIGVIRGMLALPDDNRVMTALGERSHRAYRLLEQRCGNAPYLAGSDFTAADLMMMFPLTTMRRFAPRDLSPFPNLRDYLARVGGRPAYRRAMSLSDPGLPLNLS